MHVLSCLNSLARKLRIAPEASLLWQGISQAARLWRFLVVACRCAILLDELDSDGADALWGRPYLTAMAAAATNDEGDDAAAHLDLSLLGRHVVVELKTANALPLLKYACSSRVMALPTSQLNAQRVRLAINTLLYLGGVQDTCQ